MAKVDKNSFLNGLTGKLGNEVYIRNQNGQKVVCRKPGKREKKNISHAEYDRRNWFEKCAQRARDIIADPVKRAELQARTKPGQSVYNLAVGDLIVEYYRENPRLTKKGIAGEKNSAEEADNLKKTGLTLQVENLKGDRIGTGKVILTENGLYWCFTTPVGKYLQKKKKTDFRIQIER